MVLVAKALRAVEIAPDALDVAAVAATYGDYVWVSLQRLGVRESDVPDVAQEVFVVVHRRLHTFDGRTAMTAWLYGICVRLAIAHRRRAYVRRERTVSSPPEDPAAARASGDPESALASREAHAWIQGVLNTLDPERRAVFVMYEIEELSCDEIAATVGIPRGTVHSRLHAARREFRKAYERQAARDAGGKHT
jgi:RNA polymerase sigma-70 factor (ECF subfamily)